MSMTEAAASASPSRPVRFIGADRDYWRILVRGAFLLAVTLGLYRFWLATDTRRFFWAHTTIDNEPLEYSGTSVELLQGFLVAIALVLPVYTVFLITVLDLGLFGSFLTFAAFAILAFLSQAGIYLARRYRLTRTIFRGLRCHQTGSALRYAVCAVWWWSLTLVTLGLAYPFMRATLERFKLRHTYFGDLQARFEASGWRLFVRGFAMWLAVAIPVIAMLVSLALIDWPAATGAMRGGGDVTGRIERASPGFFAAIGFAFLALCAAVVLLATLLPAFHALAMRWWVSGLRFGDIAVTSHLRTRDVYAVYLRFVGYVLLFALPLAALAFIGLLLIGITVSSYAQQVSEITGVWMIVGLYVVAALGLSTLYQGVVTLSVWRLTAQSTELSSTGELAKVHAAGTASSPLGEGIADILNLGGI